MELTIKTNPLRLAGKYWLVLVPLKDGKMVVNGKYNVLTDYGTMGVAECVSLFNIALYNVKEATVFLAEGLPDFMYKRKMQELHLANTDMIQVATCHFLQRKSDGFRKMIFTEAEKIKIDLSIQASLIS